MQKVRTLRWFIFLAIFFSASIVFIGVTGISSALYESLLAEQASNINQQLMALPTENRPNIELPTITAEVRLTYISTFFIYSLILLVVAFIFSHFAIRRINQSIEEFSQQINQIKTGQDLQNFNPSNLNFIFNELNQAFNNISELARQLGRVLNDKTLLEVKASLLSKLVIRNTRLDNWDQYTHGVFEDIYKTLPFDFICVQLTKDGEQNLNIYWHGKTNAETKLKVEQLLTKQIVDAINAANINAANNNTLIKITHYYLNEQAMDDFKPQSQLLISHLEKQPQIGCVQGVFIHSTAMQDMALRLRINSILNVLLNLLGSSRAISGYTQQLETAIHLSEQENAMAADVLYGHLLVKNTDTLAGIHYKICSSSRFSGDIIQVKRSPSGSTFVLVADATGHGLSATITIMPIISVFNAMVQKGYQLPFILNEMNKHLLKDLPDDRFVAAILIEINPNHNEISVWNGAMPPVLQLNQQGELIKSFNSKNMALGILDETMFNSTPDHLSLPLDGHLIIYSDGLIEQENKKQHAFGTQKLIEQLEKKINNDPINSIINEVLDYAEIKQPDDDISLCQIDLANIDSEKKLTRKTPLCHDLETPFEWQIKIYGQQIAQQSLPALCNEFMQVQGLSMQVKRWAFSIVHQLVQTVIDTNFLKLSSDKIKVLNLDIEEKNNWDYNQKKHFALYNLSNHYYLQLKFQGNTQDTCNQAKNPCFIIEISDNLENPSSLMEENSLANIRALADEVIVSKQGHHIQVSISSSQ